MLAFPVGCFFWLFMDGDLGNERRQRVVFVTFLGLRFGLDRTEDLTRTFLDASQHYERIIFSSIR